MIESLQSPYFSSRSAQKFSDRKPAPQTTGLFLDHHDSDIVTRLGLEATGVLANILSAEYNFYDLEGRSSCFQFLGSDTSNTLLISRTVFLRLQQLEYPQQGLACLYSPLLVK